MRRAIGCGTVAIALVLAGCGGGKRNSHPHTGILSLGTATALSAKGVPVRPGFVFPTTARRITVLSALGAVRPGSVLRITWHELDSSWTVRPLFAVSIPARSNVTAYSVGVSRGQVRPGYYRIDAALGSQRQRAYFEVVPPGDLPRKLSGSSPSGTPSGLKRGPFGADPPLSPRPSSDPSLPEGCGEPAVSAEQEFYPIIAGAGLRLPGGDCSDEAVLKAGIGSATTEVGRNEGGVAVSLDVCNDIADGSDIPGTVVDFAAFDASHPDVVAHDSVTLQAMMPYPFIIPVTDPPPGTVVKPRQKIKLDLSAFEVPIDWGIKSVTVGSDRHDYEPKPAPCDLDRYHREVSATLTVPLLPAGVVQIPVSAVDYGGRSHSITLLWPTTGDLTGTITFHAVQNVPSGVQLADADMAIVLKSDGKGGYTGTISGTQTQTLHLAVCPGSTVTPGTIKARVSASENGDTLDVKVLSESFVPPEMTPCHGQQPGKIGGALDFPQAGQALSGLKRGVDGAYEKDTAETVSGTYPYTLVYKVALHPAR